MKKRLLSFIAAAAIAAAPAAAVYAADRETGSPDVYVNGSKILFEDQAAQIVDDGFTLVPARGVFECLGYDVEWDGDAYTVEVTSDTGVRTVTLAIDSDVMKVTTYKTIMQADTEEIKLDAPAQLINDRTMIPLRAISEAFGCEVNWDPDEYRVDITSGEPILREGAQPTPEPAESEMLRMSLSSDVQSVSAGEEFDVYVKADNVPADSYMSGIVTTFSFDKTKFEFVSGTLLSESGEELASTVEAENPDYATGAKALYVIIYGDNAKKTDGNVLNVTFRSLTGESGEISLSNDYDTLRGFESYFMFNDGSDAIYEGQDMIVDKTPVKIGE